MIPRNGILGMAAALAIGAGLDTLAHAEAREKLPPIDPPQPKRPPPQPPRGTLPAPQPGRFRTYSRSSKREDKQTGAAARRRKQMARMGLPVEEPRAPFETLEAVASFTQGQELGPFALQPRQMPPRGYDKPVVFVPTSLAQAARDEVGESVQVIEQDTIFDEASEVRAEAWDVLAQQFADKAKEAVEQQMEDIMLTGTAITRISSNEAGGLDVDAVAREAWDANGSPV